MVFRLVAPFLAHMRHQSYNKAYIWGAAVYGDEIGQLLIKNKMPWDGYYDNFLHPGSSLNGKPVFWGKDFQEEPSSLYIVAVMNYHAVKQQLIDYGVPENRIICFEGSDFWNDLRDSIIGESLYAEDIKKFQNIHSGKRCFIIGNGPSLTMRDLEKIGAAGDISFACNSVRTCVSFTAWKPDYYTVIDALYINEVFSNKKNLRHILNNCKYMFARSDSILFEYYKDLDIHNLILCKIAVPQSRTDFEFSEDCSQRIYAGYTVTYTMMQIAVYMGFSEIYLLGIDHHYSHEIDEDGSSVIIDQGVQNHSGILKQDHKISGFGVPVKQTTKAYLAAKRYADAHNVRIYNATRGGRLEVFPRVDFDSLFR